MAKRTDKPKISHGVVSWAKRGEEILELPELVEQMALGKLIVKGKTEVGAAVCMQYKKELWEGSLLSLHGSKAGADAAIKSIAPDPTDESVTTSKKRERTTKRFGDDYVHDEEKQIADPFQVIVACHKALQLNKQEKMKTRNLHSEVVFNLSSSNNISDSFKKFGISDDSRDVLVAVITSEDAHKKMSQIKTLVKGTPKSFSSLKAITDQDKIKKVYKITDAELQVGSLLDAVVTRMATKDAS